MDARAEQLVRFRVKWQGFLDDLCGVRANLAPETLLAELSYLETKELLEKYHEFKHEAESYFQTLRSANGLRDGDMVSGLWYLFRNCITTQSLIEELYKEKVTMLFKLVKSNVPPSVLETLNYKELIYTHLPKEECSLNILKNLDVYKIVFEVIMDNVIKSGALTFLQNVSHVVKVSSIEDDYARDMVKTVALSSFLNETDGKYAVKGFKAQLEHIIDQNDAGKGKLHSSVHFDDDQRILKVGSVVLDEFSRSWKVAKEAVEAITVPIKGAICGTAIDSSVVMIKRTYLLVPRWMS
nr:hypothetical protein BdHM001_35760 [Bdellovibrio sp. HM001]